jgi:hypothetical protein
MGKQTSTGIKLRVATGIPATQDQPGYEAMTWVEIGEIVDLPEYGPSVQVVESNPLKTGVTEKFPGFTNYGSLAIGMELDAADVGQIALEAALPVAGVKSPQSFHIEYSATLSEYFFGSIFGNTRTPGSNNSMVGSTVATEIDSVVTRVTS